MAIILFFGSCFLVVVISTIYVTVSIRHLLKTRKERSISSAPVAEEVR